MRRFVLLLTVGALAACSKPPEPQSSDISSASIDTPSPNASGPNASPGPGVNVTAAPGVAFAYRYAVRLPNARIAAVQEQHAQMCEQLGIARCRIAGMRYRLENEHEISAMLTLKLDPAIARDFGKKAVEAVNKAEGMLVDQEISGVDAGSAIEQARRDQARLTTDLTRAEAQLAQSGTNAATRERLMQETTQLREQLRGSRTTQDQQAESLANTPMLFEYGSGEVIPGFDARSPLRDALKNAGDNAIGGLAFIIMLIGALLPWGVALAVVLLLLRFVRPRWAGRVKRYIQEGPDKDAPQ